VPWEVVGVVQDVRQFGPARAAGPQFFADMRQWPASEQVFIAFLGPYFALRSTGDPVGMIPVVQDALRALDPRVSLHNVATMDDLLANATSRQRMYATLLGVFAAIAGLLATIGVYGVMAYAVAQRTREIGVRMALGAERGQVLRQVLGQSAVLCGAGLLLGVIGAAGASRSLEGMLFGVTPLDIPTFAAMCALFALVAGIACYVPARRAAAVAPIVALRCD